MVNDGKATTFTLALKQFLACNFAFVRLLLFTHSNQMACVLGYKFKKRIIKLRRMFGLYLVCNQEPRLGDYIQVAGWYVLKQNKPCMYLHVQLS